MCVVSHKFREGMDVEERLDKMEDKLDDIYEEVVGEERIKTGRYLLYDNDGQYDKLLNKRIDFKLSKKDGNEYRLIVIKDFRDIDDVEIDKDLEIEKIELHLEVFSDNSAFGKDMSNGRTTIAMFGKGGYLFFLEKGILVHEDYTNVFMEEMKTVKNDDDVVAHFFNYQLLYDSEASEKKKQEERVKGKD